jgi:hypothetical protein
VSADLEALAQRNGAGRPEQRVRFGDLPNQTMPLEWAEQFLTIVHDEHPGVFRAILPRLYGLPDGPKRGRKGAES